MWESLNGGGDPTDDERADEDPADQVEPGPATPRERKTNA
jgi:hypothetical protein